jgi:hypothetical protein
VTVQAWFIGGQIRITEVCYRKMVIQGRDDQPPVEATESKRVDDLLDASAYAASIVFCPRPVKG